MAVKQTALLQLPPLPNLDLPFTLSHSTYNGMSLSYLLFRSHSLTVCFIMLSNLCTYFTHFTFILLSLLRHSTHYSCSFITLYLFRSDSPITLLTCFASFSCILQTKSIPLLQLTLRVVAQHSSSYMLQKISNVRFRTCITLINTQEVIEDFGKKDFMIYWHWDRKVALYKISENFSQNFKKALDNKWPWYTAALKINNF